MTTQDQHTVTGSPEESQAAYAEPTPVSPPVGEDTAFSGQEQTQTSVEPAEPIDAAPTTEFSDEPAPVDTVDATAPAPDLAEAPPVESARHSTPDHGSSPEELFAADELADLRSRWTAVQAAFVDDPKECVHKADGLVSDLVEHLTSGFAQARSRLEDQWARGEEASTEDLRVALMHYREFFERLLAV
jgi:hypothetical protein